MTLEAARAVPAPTWLGIDELTLAGKPRCILTNLQEGSVFDLLASRTQAVVTAYLWALPQRNEIEVACMDMWAPYRAACQLCLPQARIIVDKFHVVRMANQALESVRKTLRATLSDRQRRTLMHDRHVLLRRQAELSAKDQLILESWQGALPLLAQAYLCKEAFYGIWDADTVADAEQRYAAWRQQLPGELAAAFAPLTTAMANWHEEIFGYFAVSGASVTTAITEALNGVAKVTNRLGRGYSFAVVRAKMLYAKRSGLLSTSYRRTIAAMPYNLPIEQQDAEVMVDEIAYLVDMMERLALLSEAAKREKPAD